MSYLGQTMCDVEYEMGLTVIFSFHMVLKGTATDDKLLFTWYLSPLSQVLSYMTQHGSLLPSIIIIIIIIIHN